MKKIQKIQKWLRSRKTLGFLSLIGISSLVALVPSLIFLFIFCPNHWNILTEEEAYNRLYDLQLLFVMVASITFGSALESCRKTMAAIKLGEERDFKRELYKRIFPAVDILLSLIAVWMIYIRMRVDYGDPIAGFQVIFKTSFIMCLMRQFTKGMDDPATSILYDVPEKWLKNIEKEKTLEEK